ncbi:hypothetical protein NUSPORA_02313 [Nucleospora cyclopteri]
MHTQENKLNSVINEKLWNSKRILGDKTNANLQEKNREKYQNENDVNMHKIDKWRGEKEESLKIEINPNQLNKMNNNSCLKKSSAILEYSYDLNKMEEESNKDIYVFDDKVSLEGLYNQIDMINKDILKGINVGENTEMSMKDVENTKSILISSNKHSNKHNNVKEEIIDNINNNNNNTINNNINNNTIDNINNNNNNVFTLFQALKNAQFNSIKLKSKIYQFIHNEIYKIEEKYLNQIEEMKQKSAKNEREMQLKVETLKKENEEFKRNVMENVKIHVKRWEEKAKEEIERYFNK